jgi:hypothetical protein
MAEDKINTESEKIDSRRENITELDEYGTTNSTDEFDWDFIFDREWSRTKK